MGAKSSCETVTYFNPQTGYWFAAFKDGTERQRVTLRVKTKAEAEAAVKLLDGAPVVREEPAKLSWPEFQKKYLEYKRQQGKAAKTVTRFKAAMDACGRHLKAQKVDTVDKITLSVLEGFTHYRTQTESCDAKTAYTDALIIKNALKWGSKASRKLLAVNPALDWETTEPVKPKRPAYNLQ